MPLNPSQLQSGLLRVLKAQPPSAPETAKQYADAYTAYAALATAGGFPVLMTGAEALALANALASAWLDPTAGSSIASASAWATGLTSFWALVTFPPGVVAPPPVGGPALQSGLISLFTSLYTDVQPVASQMATLLDAFTRALTVTIPGAPPLIVPVI